MRLVFDCCSEVRRERLPQWNRYVLGHSLKTRDADHHAAYSQRLQVKEHLESAYAWIGNMLTDGCGCTAIFSYLSPGQHMCDKEI